MIYLLRWFLHGEDVGARLLLAAIAAATFVGAGYRPSSPEWWGLLAVNVLTALASKREPVTVTGLPAPGPDRVD